MNGIVYRFINKDEQIIYVGSAEDLLRRLRQHFEHGHLPDKCYNEVLYTKVYAIGVDYDKAREKFFARITPFGHDKQVVLHYWDTEEEAFQEYRLFKESEIRILALRYKDKIPAEIFDALIKYEVRPYSPYEDR